MNFRKSENPADLLIRFQWQMSQKVFTISNYFGPNLTSGNIFSPRDILVEWVWRLTLLTPCQHNVNPRSKKCVFRNLSFGDFFLEFSPKPHRHFLSKTNQIMDIHGFHSILSCGETICNENSSLEIDFEKNIFFGRGFKSHKHILLLRTWFQILVADISS